MGMVLEKIEQPFVQLFVPPRSPGTYHILVCSRYQTAMNEMDRVSFMTRAGTAVDSGGRINHQEAGVGEEEADHERRGRPGLARSLSRARAHAGRAAPGSISGRPGQRPAGEITCWGLEGDQ